MDASDHGKHVGSREGAKERQRWLRPLEGLSENGGLASRGLDDRDSVVGLARRAYLLEGIRGLADRNSEKPGLGLAAKKHRSHKI